MIEILSTTPESEVVTTRIVNATKEHAWKAWTNPDHLKIWWGPNGFTNTFHEFDLREGGTWKFTMHGPDKGHYENEVVFIKIDEPNLIAWDRVSKPYFQILTTFEEAEANKTKITFKMLFRSAEECAKLRPFVTDKNEENFDRLEAELKNVN